MKRLSASTLAFPVCLLLVVEGYGQRQKPVGVESLDVSPSFSLPVERDSTSASSSVASDPQSVFPRLMKFSGALRDATGKPLTGAVDVTFLFYSTEAGGEPLWFETQSVQADDLGRYTALLGAMHSDGLPVDLFTSGEVRWLGIQVGTEPEQQPRVLLVSVPYALKAGDAETLGGKPASAYVLADAQSGTATGAPTSSTSAASLAGTKGATEKGSTDGPLAFSSCFSLTTSGAALANSIAMFTTNCNIEGSAITQSGGNIGIGTATPGALLDVQNPTAPSNVALRATNANGTLMFIPNMGAGAYNNLVQAGDQGIIFYGTAPNAGNFVIGPWSGTGFPGIRMTAAGNVGIGTASPAHMLDVAGDLKSSGHFIGDGSQLTNITATSTSSLSCTSCVGNTQLGINYAGSSSQGGAATNALALNGMPSTFFQPAGSYATTGPNTFGGTQTISTGDVSIMNGDIDLPQTSATGVGVINMGGYPFIHAYGNGNTFVGSNTGNFTTTGGQNTAMGAESLYSNATGIGNTATGNSALSTNNTGNANTATGFHALYSNTAGTGNTATGYYGLSFNTTGGQNTASGWFALYDNTVGWWNTAIGLDALYYNTTAYYNTAVGGNALGNNCFQVYTGCAANLNTALGYNAGVGLGGNVTGANNTFVGASTGSSLSNLTNATAIGANAVVGESNALVLGGIGGINGAQARVNVGIGTSTPAAALHVAFGDVYLSNPGNGVILKSPDGSACRRLTIDNTGAIVLTALTCP